MYCRSQEDGDLVIYFVVSGLTDLPVSCEVAAFVSRAWVHEEPAPCRFQGYSFLFQKFLLLKLHFIYHIDPRSGQKQTSVPAAIDWTLVFP